jgi:hypothetical protein
MHPLFIRSARWVLLPVALFIVGACAESGALAPTPAQGQPTRGVDDVQSADPTVAPSPTVASEARPLMGVSLSPLSYEQDEFLTFLDHAEEAGDILRWAGSWEHLAGADSAAGVVAVLAEQRGMHAMIETGVFSVDHKELFRPLTDETLAFYRDTAVAFAEERQPAYLALGVEVNFHYEEDPDTWPLYVALFDETYHAVKAVSPETQVYPVFQLERMKGLHGGLFGGVNDENNAQWHLLDEFPQADLIGFTSYPSLLYSVLDQIPEDYYAELQARTDEPILLTETGWPSRSEVPGWEYDEVEQAEFVDLLFTAVRPLDVKAVVWVWMYEQPNSPFLFGSMTLRREDGTARPAWDAWVNAR